MLLKTVFESSCNWMRVGLGPFPRRRGRVGVRRGRELKRSNAQSAFRDGAPVAFSQAITPFAAFLLPVL